MGSKYTIELLQPIVNESESLADVMIKLGIKPVGGNHRHIGMRLKVLGIDTSHFTGRNWRKGKTKETNASLHQMNIRTLLDDNFFCENSTRKVKVTQLLTLGWKYECKACKIDEWQGKPITLHIDHISGVHTDNRFENLQLLCPNCHQQTGTWGNRKNELRDYRLYKPFKQNTV